MKTRAWSVVGVIVSILTAGPATQGGEPSGTPAPAAPAKPAPSSAGGIAPIALNLPPAVKLFQRIEQVRTTRRVIPVVMIVRDTRSYASGIAGWTGGAYYPVLIDDGTPLGREDIARFVRAFKPAAVIRHAAPDSFAWPTDSIGQWQRAIEDLVAKSTGATGTDQLREAFGKGSGAPLGVVVMSTRDPAWTAGLALAAGHGEIIAWTDEFSGGTGTTLAPPYADRLNKVAMDACASWGVKCEVLGDAVDAVTLCLNTSLRVEVTAGQSVPGSEPIITKPGDMLATTDYVGRLPDRRTRWAWCGQIFGQEAPAAYRAMCSLFLMPDNAWIFDGYEPKDAFANYSGAKTGEALAKLGLKNTPLGGPGRQGSGDWRRAVAGVFAHESRDPVGAGTGGIDAGFVYVTTMGNGDFFTLRPGSCVSADVPANAQPSRVYFVHSWSASDVQSRKIIAARFFEQGAYSYVGSVAEPYLLAFVAGPQLGERLKYMPLGAAARHDAGPGAYAWRITILSDPLLTIGPPAPRASNTLIPVGPRLDDEMKAQLQDKKLGEALTSLILLGRDKDAVRLARAMLDEHPDQLTGEPALLAAAPAFRMGDSALLARLTERAGQGQLDMNPWVKDLLWHSVQQKGELVTREQLGAFKLCVRPELFARDIKAVSDAIARLEGEPAQRAYLREMAQHAPDTPSKLIIETILKQQGVNP